MVMILVGYVSRPAKAARDPRFGGGTWRAAWRELADDWSSPVVGELSSSRNLGWPDQVLYRDLTQMKVRVDLPAQAGIVGEPNQDHGRLGRGVVRKGELNPVIGLHQVDAGVLDRLDDLAVARIGIVVGPSRWRADAD